MTESMAISYAKSHYNMNPNEEFNSVRDVVKGASKRMSRDAFRYYTEDLCIKLMMNFNCRFDEVSIES